MRVCWLVGFLSALHSVACPPSSSLVTTAIQHPRTASCVPVSRHSRGCMRGQISRQLVVELPASQLTAAACCCVLPRVSCSWWSSSPSAAWSDACLSLSCPSHGHCGSAARLSLSHPIPSGLDAVVCADLSPCTFHPSRRRAHHLRLDCVVTRWTTRTSQMWRWTAGAERVRQCSSMERRSERCPPTLSTRESTNLSMRTCRRRGSTATSSSKQGVERAADSHSRQHSQPCGR